MARPALFIDRDKTLIEDPGFISKPDQVQLIPGAADALLTAQEAGLPIVVVTNQSGVARGFFSEDDLHAIHQQVRNAFEARGVHIEAIYACPYLPGDEAKVPAYRKDSHLRKPKPGMLLEAASELDLDLSASWMIGDSLRDVQAGRAAGCRTILLHADGSPPHPKPPEADVVLSSLPAAVEYVVNNPGRGSRSNEPADTGRETLSVLRQILTTQQQQARVRSGADFSVLSLLGAVVQMLTLAVATWGFFAMIEGGEAQSLSALLRLLLAVFGQLLALTLFSMSRQK